MLRAERDVKVIASALKSCAAEGMGRRDEQ